MVNLLKWGQDRKKQIVDILDANTEDDYRRRAIQNPSAPRQTYQQQQMTKAAPTANPDLERKIRTAQYGVLANSQQAQNNLLNNIKPSTRNLAGDALKSAAQAPITVSKSIAKPFWETGDIARAAAQRDQKNFRESLDQSIIGGVGRFGQSVASTINSPASNYYANREKQRAERLLTPAYENLYKARGIDPRLGRNMAQIEAGQTDYNLRTDPLKRSNIGVNDSTGTVTRKVAAQGIEAGLDILTAPAMALATKSALKKGGKQFVKDTTKSGVLGASGNLAYTAQQDNLTPLDYAKAGGIGFATGVALPVATRAASSAVRSGAESIAEARRTSPQAQLGTEKDILRDLQSSVERARGPAKAQMKQAVLEQQAKVMALQRVVKEGGYASLPRKSRPELPKDPQQSPVPIPQVLPKRVVSSSKDSLTPTRKYTTVHQDGKSIEVHGEPIKIADDIDTFIHKDENGNWVVSEAISGRSITGGGYENKTFAIKAARDLLLERGSENVKKRINEVSSSQPIARLEIPKDPLGPPAPIPERLTPGEAHTKLVTRDRRGPGYVPPPRTDSPLRASMTEDEFFSRYNPNKPVSDAVSRYPNSPDTKVLTDAVNSDPELIRAVNQTADDGSELNYFAKRDANGRSVGIEKLDPRFHNIEAGFVVDGDGNILGNHIKVDNTGIQVSVGGKLVNMEEVLGNTAEWRDTYKVTETMDRNLQRMSPDDATYRRARAFLIDHKTKADADFRTDLKSHRDALTTTQKTIMSLKPRGVSDANFKSDLFDFVEGAINDNDIAKAYPNAVPQIVQFKSDTRHMYDTLLERVNKVFVEHGMKPVERRKDYLTHLQELSNDKSFAGKVYDDLHSSILGDAESTTRKGVPGDISGRTENFKPEKKYNPFFNERKGGKFAKDPFAAIDAYIEPTLYNIHMTPSSIRARAVEATFRTQEILKNVKPQEVSANLKEALEIYRGGEASNIVTAFQEYANALAGKTQRWDRQVIDSGPGSRSALKGWQSLQKIGGRATILGNAQSVLAQTLNQPAILADAGIQNYVKGIARSLTHNPEIEKSNFIKGRRTNATSQIRSTGAKALDAAGAPLQKAEQAFVELSWNAEYENALKKGFTGNKAIQEADRLTERAVAGRGIGDKPEAYRSTITNGLLQYTLEVAAQNKLFWKDFTPVQTAKYVAAAFAMNELMGAVTGFTPLPDYLDATIKSGQDFLKDDDRALANKVGATAQRFAGETASMNPVSTAIANNFLGQSQRKALFGQDSDLGRFDGVSAPVKVVQNAADIPINLAKGNIKEARNSALKIIPGGNQIKKTLTGAEMLMAGHAVDSAGNATYAAPSSLTGKAKALVFGPSSTNDAREHYDTNSRALTDKQTSIMNKLPVGERSDYLKGIQSKRDAPRGDSQEIIKAAFGTPLGKEFMALSSDDARKEFANQSTENRAIYDKWTDMKKALGGSVSLRTEGLDENSQKTIDKFARLTDKGKDNYLKKNPATEYDLALAQHKKDVAEGSVSKADAIKRERELGKLKIAVKYDKDLREISGLNKSQVYDLITNDPNGKQYAEQLLKYNDELVAAGIITNHPYRDKNGNVDFDPGRAGGKGKRKKIPAAALNAALEVPKIGRAKQAKQIAAKTPAANFKKARKAIPKINKQPTKLVVRKTNTA